MRIDTIFKKNPFILEKKIKNNIYLLNQNTNNIYILSREGKYIWNLLNGKNSIKDVKDKLLKKFRVKEKILFSDLFSFLKRLYKLKMVERSQYER